MPEDIPVSVHSSDPVGVAGLIGLVRQCPGLTMPTRTPQVRLVAFDRPGPGVLEALAEAADGGDEPIVLIGDLAVPDLETALNLHVTAVLPAGSVTAERLGRAVRGVLAGESDLPPRLAGALVRQMARLQREVLAPNGLSSSGLTTREVEVLRLLAEGYDTAEIAVRLRYAERTVKNVIGTVTTRLSLRNRTHAVSYALRHRLI